MDKNTISKERAAALDWALKANRLLDEKYFPTVQQAIMKGEEGQAEFKDVCSAAGLPEDMIPTLWKMLMGAQFATKGYWC